MACSEGREGVYDPDLNDDGYVTYDVLRPGETLADVLFSIVIHHSGNFPEDHPLEVQSSHQSGFKPDEDIGYHFVVGPDGTIYVGRDINARGAHVEEANTGRVGVLLIGDFEPGTQIDFPKTEFVLNLPFDSSGQLEPTADQVAATTMLIRYLDDTFGIDQVEGHSDVKASTICPGQGCSDWVEFWNAGVSD